MKTHVRSLVSLVSIFAALLLVNAMAPVADAQDLSVVYCAKQSKTDPTQPKDKSKITLRAGDIGCDPEKKEVEVKIRQTIDTCDNGTIDQAEDCEVNDLAGQTCQTLGYAGGRLGCSGCYFDTDGCYNERFVANPDGTITDNETCLMWEKKTGAVTLIGNPCGATDCADVHNVMNVYRYCVDASPFDFNCDVPGSPPDGPLFLNFLNRLNGTDGSCFAGYCDWRIPTVGEMLGILNGNNCPQGDPCTAWDNTDPAFGPTSTQYTTNSSSTEGGDPRYFWFVYGTPGATSFYGLKAGVGGHARGVRTITGCK